MPAIYGYILGINKQLARKLTWIATLENILIICKYVLVITQYEYGILVITWDQGAAKIEC